MSRPGRNPSPHAPLPQAAPQPLLPQGAADNPELAKSPLGRASLRRYERSDCEAVVAVWAAASSLAHPFLTQGFLRRERAAIMDEHLPCAETWVWEIDGAVVGFISLIGNEVGALFVHPKVARVGIGSALLARAQALHGALEVEVFSENVVGRAFYARHGFVQIGSSRHPGSGREILRLRLEANRPVRVNPAGR